MLPKQAAQGAGWITRMIWTLLSGLTTISRQLRKIDFCDDIRIFKSWPCASFFDKKKNKFHTQRLPNAHLFQSMTEEVLKIIQQSRDAIPTNRGFYYQYLCLLKKWVEYFIAGSTAEIYSEVDEDIKEVGGELVFTQVKCYSSDFSLNSVEVRNSILNFFIHYLREHSVNPTLKFVFETNTNVRKSDKLLSNWLANQGALDDVLYGQIYKKTESVLLEEIKKHRRDKLAGSKLSEEKRRNINAAYEMLRVQVSKEHLSPFLNSISWRFSSLSPEAAILEIFDEISDLLSHEKFLGKPIVLLINVLLSEIYRCSQNDEKEQRKLSVSTMSALLQKTDEELNAYINPKLISLLDTRFESLQNSIEKLQIEQLIQGARVESLNLRLEKVENFKVCPTNLTLVPNVYSDEIVGRDTTVLEIARLLNEKKRLSIHGIGGIGKSAVAKLFVQANRAHYHHVVWINSTNGLKDSIVFNEDLLFNLKLSFDKKDNLDKRFRTIIQVLNHIEGNNLIVVDNYSDDKAAREILLTLKDWNILLTTRSVLASIPSYEVLPLNFESARLLFKQGQFHVYPDSLLLRFFELVDFNTLMIELTGKTISSGLNLSLERIIDLIESQQLNKPELEIDIEIGYSEKSTRLYLHVLDTFKRENLTDAEEGFLQFLALLPTDDTKISELVEWAGKDYAEKNTVDYTNLVNGLHKKGWLKRAGDNIRMQRIIQSVIIYESRTSVSPFVGQMFQFSWLNARFREGYRNDFNQSFRFLKYGVSILQAIKEDFRSSVYQPLLAIENEVLNVYNWLVIEEDIAIRWKDLCDRAEKYLDKDDALLGTIYSNYGLALMMNEEIPAGLDYVYNAIAIFKKHGAKTAANLINAYSNLSVAMVQQRDFEKFKTTVRDAIKARKEFGISIDPSLTLQYNASGIAFQRAGDLKKAIEQFEKAISVHKTLESENRNDVYLIQFLNNLAYGLFSAGQMDRAVHSLSEALELLEKFDVGDNKMMLAIGQTLLWMCEEIGEFEMAENIRGYLY